MVFDKKLGCQRGGAFGEASNAAYAFTTDDVVDAEAVVVVDTDRGTGVRIGYEHVSGAASCPTVVKKEI